MKDTKARVRFLNQLSARDACGKALNWVAKQKSPQAAWEACDNPEWMLWLLGRSGEDCRKLVLAACQAAWLAMPETESVHARDTLTAAENWAIHGDSADFVKLCADKINFWTSESYGARNAQLVARIVGRMVEAAPEIRDMAMLADSCLFYSCQATSLPRRIECGILRKVFPEVPKLI